MEEMANTEAAPPEIQGEGTRRRATGTKRKGTSGSSASKRLAKERNLQNFHSYIHNGPVTRARQSPNKFSVTAVAPQGLIEQPIFPGSEDNGGPGERIVGEGEELEGICGPVVDPDFDFIRTRGRDVHVVPNHAG